MTMDQGRDHDRNQDRPPGPLWIFAYGSLMWQPDFDVLETRPATLFGYHRGLCIYSNTYRGTPAALGLVFGLDRGGSCKGMALRIAEDRADAVMAKVWNREMVTKVYRPRWLTAHVAGRPVTVWTFVADRDHAQYAGRPNDAETIRLIRQGHGTGGACVDYVVSTHAHLKTCGIYDRALARVVRQLDTPVSPAG